MAKKTGAYEAPTPASDKKKALETALAEIEAGFVKASEEETLLLSKETEFSNQMDDYADYHYTIFQFR